MHLPAPNPPNPQNLQTDLLGGGFTLPLPPPNRFFMAGRWRSWRTRGPLDPSKSNGKTYEKPTFSLFSPIQPPHIPIIPLFGLTKPPHIPIYRKSIENLSKIYRKSIENLSKIYRKSIEHLPKIYRTSIENRPTSINIYENRRKSSTSL